MKNFERARRMFRRIFRTPEQRYFASWIALFAAIGVFFLVLFVPISRQVLAVEMEIRAVREKTSAIQNLNISSADPSALLERLKKDAAVLSRQFISQGDVPLVIAEISRAATEQEVTLRRIQALPSQEITDSPFVRLPIMVDVDGNFIQAAELIGSLRPRIPWFFTWETVRFSTSVPGSGEVSAEIRITFYSRK